VVLRSCLAADLGAQPILASIVEEFLPEDQLIPYIESVIRVFDRYGERNNRNKARMKYLIQKIGLKKYLRLTEIERTANKVKSYPINRDTVDRPCFASNR
jgi:sulfite reductase (ferredoxin)